MWRRLLNAVIVIILLLFVDFMLRPASIRSQRESEVQEDRGQRESEVQEDPRIRNPFHLGMFDPGTKEPLIQLAYYVEVNELPREKYFNELKRCTDNYYKPAEKTATMSLGPATEPDMPAPRLAQSSVSLETGNNVSFVVEIQGLSSILSLKEKDRREKLKLRLRVQRAFDNRNEVFVSIDAVTAKYTYWPDGDLNLLPDVKYTPFDDPEMLRLEDFLRHFGSALSHCVGFGVATIRFAGVARG